MISATFKEMQIRENTGAGTKEMGTGENFNCEIAVHVGVENRKLCNIASIAKEKVVRTAKKGIWK